MQRHDSKLTQISLSISLDTAASAGSLTREPNHLPVRQTGLFTSIFSVPSQPSGRSAGAGVSPRSLNPLHKYDEHVADGWPSDRLNGGHLPA